MDKRRRTGYGVRVKSSSGMSLTQRLQNHHRKSEGPKDSTITWMAISFFWVNTFVLILEGFAVLLPSYHALSTDDQGTQSKKFTDYGSGFLWAHVATIWLLLETTCQWWFLCDGDKDVVRKTMKEKYFKKLETPFGWKRCTVCKLDAPPRSYHCKACRCCVLKRDHHCYFSGSCVGFPTQRHFVLFLLYVTVACGYAIYMQIMYLSKENLTYFIPLVAMWKTITAQTRKLSFFILIHLYICLIGLAGSLAFLGWQLQIILRGQTSHEAAKGVNTYRRTILENFRIVFGSPIQFVISVVLPVRLNLPSDGISWRY